MRHLLDTIDLAPSAIREARTLPSRFYRESESHALDRNSIFGHAWQLLHRAEELNQPGDLRLARIDGRSVILVLDRKGDLRGFHNVCRHRAGPVAQESGRVSRLRCGYHGWTYDLDGRLKATPDIASRDLDRCGHGLFPIEVGTWESFVFGSLDPRYRLESLVAGIKERIGPTHWAQMRLEQRVSYDIACNWKVYVDNYLEGYHLPLVHPGLSKILDYRRYRTETMGYHSLQTSPLTSPDNFYGDGAAWYYFLFPNMMLNILPDRLQTNLVLPLSAQRCRVHFDFYYLPDVHRRVIDRDLEFSDEIQQEDIAICERVQEGLASGVYRSGVYCERREAGVYHFHELVRNCYRRFAAETPNPEEKPCGS